MSWPKRWVPSSKSTKSRWPYARFARLLFFLARARCLSAGLRYLRLTRLPRHDRGPVPGGNRSAASCLCTVLKRAFCHYATIAYACFARLPWGRIRLYPSSVGSVGRHTHSQSFSAVYQGGLISSGGAAMADCCDLCRVWRLRVLAGCE